MTEQFANFAQSTLSVAITAKQTTINIATPLTGQTFPAQGNFRIVVQSFDVTTFNPTSAPEIMIVTAVAGNTFTVTRGAENTSAIAFATGAQVTHIITAGVMQGIASGEIAIGNTVAGGTPNDVLYIDNNGNLANSPNLAFYGATLTTGTGFIATPTAFNLIAPAAYPTGWVANWDAGTISGADGDPVSSWTGTIAATQSGAARPTLKLAANGINGKPVVNFGSGKYMQTTTGGQSLLTDFYIAAVVRPAALGNYQWYTMWGNENSHQRRGFGISGSGAGQTGWAFNGLNDDINQPNVPTINTPYFVEMQKIDNEFAFWVNGLPMLNPRIVKTTLTAFASAVITLGSNNTGGSEYWSGDIARILIKSSIPTTAERAALYTAVANDYAITLSPDVFSPLNTGRIVARSYGAGGSTGNGDTEHFLISDWHQDASGPNVLRLQQKSLYGFSAIYAVPSDVGDESEGGIGGAWGYGNSNCGGVFQSAVYNEASDLSFAFSVPYRIVQTIALSPGQITSYRRMECEGGSSQSIWFYALDSAYPNESKWFGIQAAGVSVGPQSATAALHIKAGTITAGTAPLKFNSGPVLTTPETGAVEFDGTHYYGSVGTTRYQLDQQLSAATSFTQGSVIFAGASGVLSQDNANFFWDATNHRLSLGVAAGGAATLNLPTGTTTASGILFGDINLYRSASGVLTLNSSSFAFQGTGTLSAAGQLNLTAASTRNMVFTVSGGGAQQFTGGNVSVGTLSALGILDVQNGNMTLVIGADANATTRTTNTRKFCRFAMPPYTNGGSNIGLIVGDADGTNNIINIGGGTATVAAATMVKTFIGTTIFASSVIPQTWTDINGMSVGTAAAPSAILDTGGSTTTRSGFRIRSGTAPASPNDGDIWYDGVKLNASEGGATVSLPIIEPPSLTGISGTATSQNLAFTIPSGRTFIMTGFVARCTAATAITVGPSISVGSTSGGTDIYPSTAITALTATTKAFNQPIIGMTLALAAASTIYFNITNAATGTAQTLAFDIRGYFVS